MRPSRPKPVTGPGRLLIDGVEVAAFESVTYQEAAPRSIEDDVATALASVEAEGSLRGRVYASDETKARYLAECRARVIRFDEPAAPQNRHERRANAAIARRR